jgi:large subunit ribosomal protein L22
MLAKAVLRKIRVSPQKLNLIAQQIRGKKVDAADTLLRFSNKRAASDVLKTLRSAIANAENNHGLDIDQLVVNEAHVGQSFALKRFQPRAKGRAGRIKKYFAHLTIVLKEQED